MNIEHPSTLDILPSSQPATSSTSDMPTVETKPDSQAAPAADENTAATTETKPPATTEAEDQGGDPKGGEEQEGEQGKSKGVKVALDRLARQREEQRERAEAAEKRERDLQARLEQAQRPKPAEEPKRDDYADPDDYIDAVAEFRAEKKAQEKLQKVEQERQDQEILRQAEKQREQYNERRESARAELTDFDAVADREDVQVPMACAHAIMTHELGPKIQYYLGKNPDQAKALFELNPVAAVARIGEIAAELRKPPAPKPVSKAPAPIKPVGNRSGAAVKDLNEMSMDEYAAHRYPDRYGKK